MHCVSGIIMVLFLYEFCLKNRTTEGNDCCTEDGERYAAAAKSFTAGEA